MQCRQYSDNSIRNEKTQVCMSIKYTSNRQDAGTYMQTHTATQNQESQNSRLCQLWLYCVCRYLMFAVKTHSLPLGNNWHRLLQQPFYTDMALWGKCSPRVKKTGLSWGRHNVTYLPTYMHVCGLNMYLHICMYICIEVTYVPTHM
jgi:hypothetical protein